MITHICPRCGKERKIKSKENKTIKKFCGYCNQRADKMSTVNLEDMYDYPLENIGDCIDDLSRSYYIIPVSNPLNFRDINKRTN